MTYFNKNIQYFTDYNQWLIEQMDITDCDHIECGRVGDDIFFKLAD